ncbi:hypothetical protein C8R43DRAFT_1118325 [Mycena crocata]|nr:hypothetical protein C8R43DRAFT_1118325 [Mycena crocata]
MPARGDRNAPQFNSQKPRELPRYFQDLQYLFTRANVTDSTEKKQHSTRFLTVEDQAVWETLEQFTDAAKSFDEFKTAVLSLYPGTDPDRTHSLADLNSLIEEYAHVGIHSKADFSEFYRQFLVISKYLVDKGRLSVGEKSRYFQRAIQPASLWDRVHRRLQIKHPDVHPQDPYDIADMYEAVDFALADTSTVPTSSSSPKPEVKQEALLEVVQELLKHVVARDLSTQQSGSGQSDSARSNACNYCSDASHFINRCPHVQADMDAGKCRRDADGKVVLPSGAFVPRRINGANLRARIEEWHRQNPGQLASAQLAFHISQDHRVDPPYIPPVSTSFQLSAEERIQSLEREIYALRTRAQARAAAAAGEPVEEPEQPIRAVKPPVQPQPPVQPPASPVRPATSAAPPPPARDRPPHLDPEHPYAKARDAAYAPPKDRNVGALPPQQKKPETAYRTTAPIFDDKIASKVFDRSMDIPVMMTQRELLSLSPEVRAQVRDATTSRRVVSGAKDKSKAPAAPNYVVDSRADVFPFALEPSIIEDTPAEQQHKDARMSAFLDSMPAAYTEAVRSSSGLPPGAFVLQDPYETFYSSGTVPDDLIVSLESSAIRSILPVIDNKQVVECIVDPGSQIIAMSEAVCHELALVYDPRIILQMQSANGSISPSLGLARNVPFLIGDITLYLQVHVVRGPAYDILLGRPFDVLTQSIVHNFANEDQTITICDPNTGHISTVPTVPRGPPRIRQEGFQKPRN